MGRVEAENHASQLTNLSVGEVVEERLERLEIRPNESLGQHFLVDDSAVELLANSVSPGNKVIEVGAGIGQLTESLARKAEKVVSVEIDRRYEPILSELEVEHPNLRVIYGEVLALRLEDYIEKDEEVQIIASLPYHITEPFLRKIVGLNIESATMVVGRKLAESIQAKNEESLGFGKLTLLAQAFYDIKVLAEVERECFLPQPRTESSIIQLIRQDKATNMRDFLLRKLFLTSRNSPLVKNCLKEGLTEYLESQDLGIRSKKEKNRYSRRTVNLDLRDAMDEYNAFGEIRQKGNEGKRFHLVRAGERAIIDGLGVPEEILGKPFDRLNNTELRTLSLALRKRD